MCGAGCCPTVLECFAALNGVAIGDDWVFWHPTHRGMSEALLVRHVPTNRAGLFLHHNVHSQHVRNVGGQRQDAGNTRKLILFFQHEEMWPAVQLGKASGRRVDLGQWQPTCDAALALHGGAWGSYS
jgi:hypothetical protein